MKENQISPKNARIVIAIIERVVAEIEAEDAAKTLEQPQPSSHCIADASIKRGSDE